MKLLPIWGFMCILAGCGSSNENSAESTVTRDITQLPLGSYSSKYSEMNKYEGLKELFDESVDTKYLSKENNVWVQWKANTEEVVHGYSITSGNDEPSRDPVKWQLLASNDAKDWDILDKVNDAKFENRKEIKKFPINNVKAYRFFRLELSHNGTSSGADEYLQLSDFSLYAETKLPLASFSLSKPVVQLGEKVMLSSTSANSPVTDKWHVPGGKLVKSGSKVEVIYEKPGVYDISLTSTNSFGSDTIEKKYAVKVLDPQNPWQGFKAPRIVLNYEDQQSAGYQRINKLFPEIKKDINQVTLALVKSLYHNFTEVPDFEQLTFTLKWMDTLAYRNGSNDNMVIAFSSKYITERLKDKTDEQVKYELLGVFWHELTHGYQLLPKGLAYSSSGDVHAFIEGMADFIRIEAGFHKTRTPKPSKSWLGGYTNTGFFLQYIAQNTVEDFGYKFNQTANTVPNWTFERAIESVTGRPVKFLWKEYQQSLKSPKDS